MKLGIYCRISKVKDGNDLSIPDQKQKGIKKAKELGLPYELYIDEGISGASDKIEDRPEFARFIAIFQMVRYQQYMHMINQDLKEILR